MALLSIPGRVSLFQNEKVPTKLQNWKKVAEIKRALKTEEYLHRHLRESYQDDNDQVALNIGGTNFRTRKSTLRNVPKTKLSSLNEKDDHYNKNTKEYFFDRNPFLFGYILDFYRTGTMHLPSHYCANSVREELRFWDLGDGCISECCRKPYFDALDANTTYELVKAEFYSLPTYMESKESKTSMTTINSRWQQFKHWAWVFIDNHESSIFAKLFAVFYYGLIVLTIINLFVSTLPHLRSPARKHVLIRGSDNSGLPAYNYTKTLTNSTTIYNILTTDPPDALVTLDVICLIFFTFEFVFRLVVCPSIAERFRSMYTILDVLYLVPAWTKLLIDVSSPFYWQRGQSEAYLLVFLDSMLILRVFRIFRLSRHYRGLRVLLLAFKASLGELTLLIVFVILTLMIFASLVYCAEQYEDSNYFESIFKGLWWSLITLTTVGYGDAYPTGTLGRLIASVCALTGLLIIGMVIPIIAGNFGQYYGFRHAGIEDFELYKPEFIPSERENPAPDCTMEEFTPVDRRISKSSTNIRVKSPLMRITSPEVLHSHSKEKLTKTMTCPLPTANAVAPLTPLNKTSEASISTSKTAVVVTSPV